MRGTVAALVFDKALASARGSVAHSRAAALLARDPDRLETFILFAHNLWSAPLNAAWVCLMLVYLLGLPALVSPPSRPMHISMHEHEYKQTNTHLPPHLFSHTLVREAKFQPSISTTRC